MISRLLRDSVRLRLALWNVGVLALVLVVLGGTLRYQVHANLLAAIDRGLVWQTERFNTFYQREGLPRWMRERRPNDPSPPPFLRPRMSDPEGKPLSPLLETTPWDRASFAQSLRGRTVVSTRIASDGQMIRVRSVPMIRDGKTRGVVQFVFPLADLNREVTDLTRALLTLIPVGLVIAAIGGVFLTDRALRPVRQVTQTASRIQASDLSGRLPVTGNDEFATLARTFNDMLGRLESAFGEMEEALARQQRFTADASHELRTPLTIIKANASLALRGTRTPDEYRQSLEAVNRAADRTTGIVADLLLLARADGGQLGREPKPVSIAEVLLQAADAVRRPDGAPIEIDPAVVDAPSVLVDASELVRVFANLFDNALRHTPRDGRIHASISEAAADGECEIAIADAGEGIPAEHLPHVTERFYRVDAARSRGQAHGDGGTGLGLAICQSIVAAYGGRLRIESVVGEGTTVFVTLPVPPVAPVEAAREKPTAVAA